jgi:formylglycine-generating enzyme required for sulfatase activity
MSANRGEADLEREMWAAAARCHRAAGKPLDAGRCLERAGRWQEAGRCYEEGGAWKEAARCYEKDSQSLEAAWLYADELGWYANAEAALSEAEQRCDEVRESAGHELARELIRARCAAGRRRDAEAAMRLRGVLGRAAETRPVERRVLRRWAARVSEVLRRPDLGLELHWELASGDEESETEWEAYTTRVLGEPVAYPNMGQWSDAGGSGFWFVEPTTGMRFLWVPGGRFWMGSEADEEKAFAWEKPRHLVEVSGYWLAETAVTNGQYELFLREQRGSREPAMWRDRRYNQPEQPVVGVNWLEARKFCQWLSERSGRRIELPTEAQRERAARGDDGRKYPWGDEDPHGTRAHYGQRWEDVPLPVGSLPAGRGPYGHLDLAGNVMEWCRDAWDEHAYEKRGQLTVDPEVSGKADGGPGEHRACRGGAFNGGPVTLRSAFRDGGLADGRGRVLGFRVAGLPAQTTDHTREIRKRFPCPDVIGRSSAIAGVLKQAALVAPLDVDILITGPSGTGKTLLAHAIAQNSPRARGPFVEFNCAALPQAQIESELFGAVRGAHSTARECIPGKVEAAQGGILFLYEIAELTPGAQAKLLQLLQSRTYYPVGASRPHEADVRIVSATSAHLKDMVAQRRFREDLCFRLDAMRICMPTLSERRADIPLLVEHIVAGVCWRYGVPAMTVSRATLVACQEAPWHGNVRALAHAVEAAVICARGLDQHILRTEHFFPDRRDRM